MDNREFDETEEEEIEKLFSLDELLSEDDIEEGESERLFSLDELLLSEDETEEDEGEKLFSLDELLSEDEVEEELEDIKTLSEEDRSKLLSDELLDETNYEELVKDRDPTLYSDEYMTTEEIAEKIGCKTNPLRDESYLDGLESYRINEDRSKNIEKEVNLEDVRRLYVDDGLSLKKIGEQYGFKSGKPIKRILQSVGIEIRPVGFQKIEIDPDEVHRLYFEERKSLKDVADHVACKSTDPIHRIFEEQDWTTQDQSPLFEVLISEISIRDIRIESEEKLEQIINEQFPSLTERDDYDRLFNYTKSYLKLVERCSDQKNITSQELLELSASYQIPKETIKGWLCESKTPKLLVLLNQALSIDEAVELRDDIIERLDGVTSTEKAQERFDTYYLWEKVQSFPKLEKLIETSNRFFRFFDTLSEGGLISEIGRRSGNSKDDVTRWVRQKQIPSFALLASKIPSDRPKSGNKWIPLKIKSGGLGIPEKFIQVPVEDLTAERISTFLRQLEPVDNPKVVEHEKKFGSLTREHALMYLIGAILSDGSFSYAGSISSASIKLKASKKYDWGMDFGEGFCYCMERVGIVRGPMSEGVTRQKNGTIVEFNQWKSENNPLNVWIENSLLGLRGGKSKSETPAKMEWVYSMPHSWKVKFLQGVTDGDGHASLKSQKVGITSVANVEFLAGLLRSMEIEPTTTDIRVEVHRQESIQKLNKFPMFKYATGRQKQLSQLADLLSSTRNGTYLSDNARKLVYKLGNNGLSSGEISEKLWLEYSIAIRSGTIRTMLKEVKKK